MGVAITNLLIYTDIYTVGAFKASENYQNLSTGFKNVFDDINYYIAHSNMKVNEKNYTL